MIKTIDEGIVVFHNTHDAIKADNICDTEKCRTGSGSSFNFPWMRFHAENFME